MTTDRKYQTFWPRFWAGLVDAIVFLPISAVNVWILSSDLPTLVRAVWYAVFAFSFSAYIIAMHARYGQTLGKMVTGVKVLDLTEERLSPRQAVLREIVPVGLIALGVAIDLPSVLRGENLMQREVIGVGQWLQLAAGLGWFAAEILTMLANPKRRALHDYIAGSVVVRFRRSTPGSPLR